MPGGAGADPFSIPRELDGYAIADIISIPSRHVAESFVAEGIADRQLMINPYGCDLAMFPPTARKGTPERSILFVGTWSRRKGCDTLVEAWRELDGARLLHVGPAGDLPLPVDSNFVHVDAVSQERLSEFYAQADVFVLASREEGLALVQAQALASGLSVVCTTRAGGADLRDLTGAGRAVVEVEPDDPVALAAAMKEALAISAQQGSGPRKVVRDLTALSWRAYGARYDANLRTLPISRATHARLVTA
jgi:glycosyltransferase involved in cell wall biosynthesis